MSAMSDVRQEIAWLDTMRPLMPDYALAKKTRSERAEAFAARCAAVAKYAAQERADLKSDLSYSDRFDGFLKGCALNDLRVRLSIYAPCYAIVAAGHAKRLARAEATR